MEYSAEHLLRAALVRMGRAGLRLLRSLLEQYPTAAAGRDDGWRKIHNQEDRRRLSRASAAKVLKETQAILEGWHIKLAVPGEKGYPSLLVNCPGHPLLLFIRGRTSWAGGLPLAIVGTRKATRYGLAVAERLASRAAGYGLAVISGLAYGIDAQAHRSTIEAGGQTVAVLPCGLDRVYPAVHRRLAERIRSQGALISEYFPGTRPHRGTFPERNRIIAGSSWGTVVVEAGKPSGALITAGQAATYGRFVMAVPGPVSSEKSLGCNELIRDGAGIMTSIDDVFDQYTELPPPQLPRRASNLPAGSQQVMAQLSGGRRHLDELIESTQLDASELLALLSLLEINGHIKSNGYHEYWIAMQ